MFGVITKNTWFLSLQDVQLRLQQQRLANKQRVSLLLHNKGVKHKG